jgi:hypothetical protein
MMQRHLEPALMALIEVRWVEAWRRPSSTPWPRRIVLLLAMSFHVGILVLMGLNTFALIMIGAELLLLSDGDVEALVGIWKRVRPR